MNDLISRAEAIAVMKEECWKDREMKLSDRIERRLAALCAQQPAAPVSGVTVQEAGWQPIDTAPRDGAWVLLHGLCEIPCIDAGSPETVMAYWTNHNGGGWVWHGAVAMTFTHWLPLPEPPDLSALEGK